MEKALLITYQRAIHIDMVGRKDWREIRKGDLQGLDIGKHGGI